MKFKSEITIAVFTLMFVVLLDFRVFSQNKNEKCINYGDYYEI